MFRTLLARNTRSNLVLTTRRDLINRTRLLTTSFKAEPNTSTAMPDITTRPASRSPSPPAKRARLDLTPSMNTPPQDFPTAPTEQAQASSSSSSKPAPTSTSTSNEKEPLDELVEREMSGGIEVPRTYTREIDYENKLVLAPMVRTGSMPCRLLSLHYQAGLVWGPEVVDKAIIGAERLVDPETGVITYSKKGGDGKPIFQCHPVEKPFLIFQIGSSDPESAVKAAKVVQQDVAGFDLNCGCPKPFSVHSGMGAALLSTPDLLLDILRALLKEIPLPISCKIRLLPEQPSTLHLAARILRTGVRCLTVHCRTRDMRSSVKALWERLGDIVQLGKRRGIPVVCNGDGQGWGNWESIRNKTGVSSVMIARAAESNPSIFRPEGPVPTCEELIPNVFLPAVVYLNNHYSNTKFLLAQFKPSLPPISPMNKKERHEYSIATAAARTIEDALAIWKLDKEECRIKGEAFVKSLREELVKRDPTAYGDELGKDEVAAEDQPTIWDKRKDAEDKGETVDELPSERVIQQEEEDEEAALNA